VYLCATCDPPGSVKETEARVDAFVRGGMRPRGG